MCFFKTVTACLLMFLLSGFQVRLCRGQIIPSVAGVPGPQSTDTVGSILLYFNGKNTKVPHLNYPTLTRLLYKENSFKYIWLSDTDKRSVQELIDLFSSVSQYGLDSADFHPKYLFSSSVQSIFHASVLTTEEYMARTDILITDAVITLISQLHFGKYNPWISKEDIDKGVIKSSPVISVFKRTCASKDKVSELENTQPEYHKYKKLQQYLKSKLVTSGGWLPRTGDSLKLIAANLERYRWTRMEDSVLVDINIPAFNLSFISREQKSDFKVIVGKPSSPTPTLKSEIRYFTTAPDWNIPAGIFRKEILPRALKRPSYLTEHNIAIYSRKGQIIEATAANLKKVKSDPSAYTARQSSGCDNALGSIVFNFKNPYSVYLHDTPEPRLFNQQYRAFSHGCIRLQNPKGLVALVLDNDKASSTKTILPTVYNAMDQYKRYRYTLSKPIPIYINYITCEVKDGQLMTYNDLYGRDKELFDKIFK